MFKVFVELVLVAAIIAVGVTQVVVPLWRGRRLFPVFRHREVERELIDARVDVDEARMEAELRVEQAAAKSLRDNTEVR